MDIFKIFSGGEDKNLRKVWEQLEPRIAHLKKPTVSLLVKDEKTKSNFGGNPILDSTDFPWPMSNGKPLSFLAQLDLAEIASAHKFDWLPSTGSLLFFYDVEEMPWGFDPKDRGKWKVIYQEDPKFSIDLPTALAQEFIIPENYLVAQKDMVLPDLEYPEPSQLNFSDEDFDAYGEYKDEMRDNYHRVGGHPSVIQNNTMELECQLASNGIYVGEPEGYNSQKAKDLTPGAKDWRLLLQVDSDDDEGMMWGDLGRLYFWVREQDARKKNFDNVWLILQCS
jgi:uncharacterized protein YwqG